eukprot:4116257-Pleurochrysis_carterae.AAC.1
MPHCMGRTERRKRREKEGTTLAALEDWAVDLGPLYSGRRRNRRSRHPVLLDEQGAGVGVARSGRTASVRVQGRPPTAAAPIVTTPC